MRTLRGHCGAQASRPSRWGVSVALVFTLLSCGRDLRVADPAQLGVTEIELSVPECVVSGALFTIDTVATGLEVPWDAAFLSDGRALVTERPGRIREIRADGTLLVEPWAEVEVFSVPSLEAGLLGIDVLERSGAAPRVYVGAVVEHVPRNLLERVSAGVSRRTARVLNPERGQSRTFQIIAYTDRGSRGADPQVVVSGLPSGPIHGGGALRVGPDGFLYVSNGDAAQPPFAQDMRSTRGKILRYTLEGAIPESNPFVGSPVFATGVRHVQGIAWLDETTMLIIEHGPSGLEPEAYRTDDDELNLVVPGANFGWPVVTGATVGGPFTSPIAAWAPRIAPAGLSVVPGADEGGTVDLIIASLRGGVIRVRLDATSETPSVVCQEEVVPAHLGRWRLSRAAPDGSIWVGSSNRDGRGIPGSGDDVILRLRRRLADDL